MPETALHGSALFAERLRRRVMHHDFADPGEDPLNLTISIGLSSFPDDRVTSADSFAAPAHQALYRAKNEGRNLVRQWASGAAPSAARCTPIPRAFAPATATCWSKCSRRRRCPPPPPPAPPPARPRNRSEERRGGEGGR